jgi:Anti-sigma-K factor rskA/Putative zinc-finger
MSVNEETNPAFDHEHVRSLLAPFALNALEEGDHQLVSAHIETCDACAAEVVDLLDTSSLLALGAHDAPPDNVWTKLQSAMTESTTPAQSDLPQSDLPQPVIDLTMERNKRRSGKRMAIRALTAAAAVLLIVVPVTRMSRPGTPTIDQLAASAAKANGSRTLDLMSVDKTKQKLGSVVLAADGRGYITLTDLPKLSADETYQLWAIIDGKPISEGLLGPSPTIAAFNTSAKVAAIAISVEKSSGATAPTIGPIAVASL